MYSLRSLYRLMLITWLALILGIGGILAYSTKTGNDGNLFAFLFKKTPEPEALPPVVVEQLPPKLPEPKPTIVAKKPDTQWVALKKGKRNGKGTLSKPEITILENGDLEIRFKASDAPGNFRSFYPSNVDSISVDLLGSWGKNIFLDQRVTSGVLARIQVADHKQWLRVSGVANDNKTVLDAKVEYAPTLRALRVVFSKKQ